MDQYIDINFGADRPAITSEAECDNNWCRQPVCFELIFMFDKINSRCCAECTFKLMNGECAKNYEIRSMLSQ